MPDLRPRPRLVFLHLPKTGGTTLHETIARQLPKDATCPFRFNVLQLQPPGTLEAYSFFSGHYDHEGMACIPDPKLVVTVLREPRERLFSLYLFLSRHTELTIRVLGSGIARLARDCPDFAEFLRRAAELYLNQVDNVMARQLAGRFWVAERGVYLEAGVAVEPAAILARAEANLRRIDILGTMENLPQFYARVAAAWGLAPAELPRLNTREEVRGDFEQARQEVITPEAEAAMADLIALDMPLYRLAQALEAEALAATASAARP